jgi:hypothetical protein
VRLFKVKARFESARGVFSSPGWSAWREVGGI